MGKLKEHYSERMPNNIVMNMDLWVKHYFGTQDALDKKLGLSIKTTNRWMNSKPRNFLAKLPEISKVTGQPTEDIVQMIMQRQNDVEQITG